MQLLPRRPNPRLSLRFLQPSMSLCSRQGTFSCTGRGSVQLRLGAPKIWFHPSLACCMLTALCAGTSGSSQRLVPRPRLSLLHRHLWLLRSLLLQQGVAVSTRAAFDRVWDRSRTCHLHLRSRQSSRRRMAPSLSSARAWVSLRFFTASLWKSSGASPCTRKRWMRRQRRSARPRLHSRSQPLPLPQQLRAPLRLRRTRSLLRLPPRRAFLPACVLPSRAPSADAAQHRRVRLGMSRMGLMRRL